MGNSGEEVRELGGSQQENSNEDYAEISSFSVKYQLGGAVICESSKRKSHNSQPWEDLGCGCGQATWQRGSRTSLYLLYRVMEFSEPTVLEVLVLKQFLKPL